MTRGQRKFITSIIAIAVVVLIVVGIVNRGKDPGKPPATGPQTQVSAPPVGNAATSSAPARPPARIPADPVTRTATTTQRSDAAALLERGLKLLEADKPIGARSALADALNSGALSSEQADLARAKLAGVVATTLFSTRQFENDPCVQWYQFKTGDVLVNVERQLKLRVPTQLLLKINGIPSANKIQAGQTVKCIRGPFHAVIYKGRFIMDVYLEEPSTKRMIFARRFGVGVGKDGSTPLGRWRVAKGRKMENAPWTPPVSSKLPRRKVLFGQEGYPLGQKGYWISLEGIDGTVYTAEDGYGIHGTADRDSIGKASSMGCIRLVDEDMELVFAMLYEHWSTVAVRE